MVLNSFVPNLRLCNLHTTTDEFSTGRKVWPATSSTQDRSIGSLSNDDGSCTAVAREWFQASNLIQSRQIQNKQSVSIRRIRVKTLTHIYIYFHNLWIEFRTAITRHFWKRAVPLPCNTADPVEFNCLVEPNLSFWTEWFQTSRHCRAKFYELSAARQ